MAPWVIASIVAAAWCLLALWAGPKLGFVDRPDRSSLTAHHRVAVPLGGVGVYLGLNLAALARGGVDVPLLVGTSIVLILGLLDDRLGLTPSLRLAVEMVAAISIVAMGAYTGGFVFQGFAVFLIVVAINAVNLYDGLDGLVGLTSIVTALGLALVFVGRGLDTAPPVELAAALAGFLIFNWHPARVFLGDSGSYVVGLVLAHQVLSSSSPALTQGLVTSSIFGIFFVDLAASVIRRVRSGAGLFEGDRDHIYDQMRRRGLSIPKIALISAAVQAAFVLLVLGVDRLRTAIGLVVIASVAVSSLLLLWKAGALTPDVG